MTKRLQPCDSQKNIWEFSIVEAEREHKQCNYDLESRTRGSSARQSQDMALVRRMRQKHEENTQRTLKWSFRWTPPALCDEPTRDAKRQRTSASQTLMQCEAIRDVEYDEPSASTILPIADVPAVPPTILPIANVPEEERQASRAGTLPSKLQYMQRAWTVHKRLNPEDVSRET